MDIPSPKSSMAPVLLTLLCAAFTAWAGVIVWFGNAINDRLFHLQGTMERVEAEMGEFKITVTERVTRVEERVRLGNESGKGSR